MTTWQLIGVIAGGAGLVLGILVARRSHQESPLLSGVGHIFNYLASVAIVMVPIAVITGLVLASFRQGVTVALVALGSAIALVLLSAVPEVLAHRNRPDMQQGFFGLAWDRWTALATPLGDFNAWLLFGLFYFTVMLPFGIISRLSSDRLRQKKAAPGEALWLARDQAAELTLDDARRQY